MRPMNAGKGKSGIAAIREGILVLRGRRCDLKYVRDEVSTAFRLFS